MPSERTDRLEERLAWLERHVTEQDKAMLALHEEIARLRTELKQLRERPTAAPAPSEAVEQDERPPHY
jgi:SlyX protein